MPTNASRAAILEGLQGLWTGDSPYKCYQDPEEGALDPAWAVAALAADRILGFSKKRYHSVLIDGQGLFLVETMGNRKRVQRDDALLRVMVCAGALPPGNVKFGLVHTQKTPDGIVGSTQDAAGVVPMTLVAPTLRVGCAKDECLRYYELPADYVGGDLLALIPDHPDGQLTFAAVNGKKVAGSVEGNDRRFALDEVGSIVSAMPNYRDRPVDRWERGAPEILAASTNGGPGPAFVPVEAFAGLAMDATFQFPGAERPITLTDGSLVEVRDGKLWCSSTADPATHKWVPLITLDAMVPPPKGRAA